MAQPRRRAENPDIQASPGNVCATQTSERVVNVFDFPTLSRRGWSKHMKSFLARACALLALSIPLHSTAGTPSSGTLTTATSTLNYTVGPFSQSNLNRSRFPGHARGRNSRRHFE